MTTDLFGTTPATPSATASAQRTGRRVVSLGIAASAALAMFIGGMAGTASAAPGETDTGSTQARVGVLTSITLTGLPTSFTLNGIPGTTQSADGDVTMNVETNNLAGYAVTVASVTNTLLPSAVGNTDSIPISALSVRETLTTAWQEMPLVDPNPLLDNGVTVHTQDVRSEEGGDTISNDYQIEIPFVNEDTYTATLDYIATTL